MKIVFKDDALLVIDKPAGQHSQAPASGPDDSVLAEAQRAFGSEVRIVHRLDRDASGLLVLALTKASAAWLSAAFRDHTAKRTYRAWIAVPLQVGAEGTIDAPLKWAGGRCWVDDSGAKAVTHYRVLSREQGRTELEIHLETGRMHQIRVHLKHALGPIIGDRKYGGKRHDHLMLRAVRLEVGGRAFEAQPSV